MRLFTVTFLICCTVLLSSCLIQAPKYSMLENVMKLKPGLTLQQVNDTLDLEPYSIKNRDSSGKYTIIYKYRVYDRSTIPFFLKRKNGVTVKGKFVTLLAHFDKNNLLTSFDTCTDCD